MTEKTLKISAQLERKLAWHRGQSVRHVVCELEAPKMVREENEQEARINLALVLDTSGSMSESRCRLPSRQLWQLPNC